MYTRVFLTVYNAEGSGFVNAKKYIKKMFIVMFSVGHIHILQQDLKKEVN